MKVEKEALQQHDLRGGCCRRRRPLQHRRRSTLQAHNFTTHNARTHREYEAAAPAAASAGEHDKAADRVRALWHRQLAVPLAGGEEALAAYEAWEAATGKVRVERCIFYNVCYRFGCAGVSLGGVAGGGEEALGATWQQHSLLAHSYTLDRANTGARA